MSWNVLDLIDGAVLDHDRTSVDAMRWAADNTPPRTPRLQPIVVTQEDFDALARIFAAVAAEAQAYVRAVLEGLREPMRALTAYMAQVERADVERRARLRHMRHLYRQRRR